MELIEARILLKNLLNRVETGENGSGQLSGTLTAEELAALHLAASILDGGTPTSPKVPPSIQPPLGMPSSEVRIDGKGGGQIQKVNEREAPFELDLSALDPPPPPPNVRLCLDFGTAMSKATLIEDNVIGEDQEDAFERIVVLNLGIPGDQEEVSLTMLISSVYIDNKGLLWFGKAAVDRSLVEGQDGSRRRLDNIKRSLSEGALETKVPEAYNPTSTRINFGDMILAYLLFLTWAVNRRLEHLDYSRYLPRRFAMPCLPSAEGKDKAHQLAKRLGEAQVLADTFSRTLKSGIPLTDFVRAVASLRSKDRTYRFVSESVSEPLGVAGSMLSWRNPANMLVMVVDVGAGTSDFSLFRINVDPEKGTNTSVEVAESARGITEAGNYLDRILIEFLLKKAGVTRETDGSFRIRSALELRIRDHKETLFNEGLLIVPLLNETVVEIDLKEFLELDAVKKFGWSLRETMQGILDKIRPSWGRWVQADLKRRLVVVTTGGGGMLPMVRQLVVGSVDVQGRKIPLAAALPFPTWLRDIDANLEADYPQIAVSLGGARRNLILREGTATITAGDVIAPATIQGYYQKGN